MKVRLLESAHETWAPAGTVGELTEVNGNYKFCPEGHEHAYWIGRVKWEEVGEMVAVAETVKTRKRWK